MKSRSPILAFALALTFLYWIGFDLNANLTFIGQWGYILRYLAGQTPSLIVRGRSPQLFHSGEIDFQFENKKKEIESQLKPNILRVLTLLRSKGLEVVLLPIPTKTSIERHLLPTQLPCGNAYFCPADQTFEDPHKVYHAIAEIDPTATIDLFSTFVANRENGAIYPSTDYHWSSFGSALAAEQIQKHLIEKRWELSASKPIRSSAGRPVGHSYLISLFQLPDWFIKTRPELWYQQVLYDLFPQNQGQSARRTILSGTSFSLSQEPGYFAQQLKQATGNETLLFAKANGGYAGGFQMMQESGFKFQPGDLFVWELPLCCLNLGTEIPRSISF